MTVDLNKKDELILKILSIFGIILIIFGIVIILIPGLLFIAAKFNTTLYYYIDDFIPHKFVAAIIFCVIPGGYLMTTGFGFFRRKIWGPIVGIFLLVFAILCLRYLFMGDDEIIPRMIVGSIGVIISLIYLLPFFVWRHYLNNGKHT